MEAVVSFVVAGVVAGIGIAIGDAAARRRRTLVGAVLVLVAAALVTLLAGVGLHALTGVPDVDWLGTAVSAGVAAQAAWLATKGRGRRAGADRQDAR